MNVGQNDYIHFLIIILSIGKPLIEFIAINNYISKYNHICFKNSYCYYIGRYKVDGVEEMKLFDLR